MKNLKKKQALLIIFMIVAIQIAGIPVILIYMMNEIESDYISCAEELRTFGDTYEYICDQISSEAMDVMNDEKTHVKLIASAINSGSSGIEPCSFDEGYIIRKTGDESGLPEGFPYPEDAADIAYSIENSMENGTGYYENETSAALYALIRDDYYYIEYDDNKTDEALYSSYGSWEEIIAPLYDFADKKEGCYMFADYKVDSEGAGDDDEVSLSVATGVFRGCSKLSDIRLTSGQLRKAVKAKAVTAAYYKKKIYIVQAIDYGSDTNPGTVLLLKEFATLFRRSVKQCGFVFSIIILILTALAIWVVSIFETMCRRPLTEKEEASWAPAELRKRLIALIAAGAVVVFAAAVYSGSLVSVFLQANRSHEALQSFFTMIDNSEAANEAVWEKAQKRYNSNAKLTATLIDRYSGLQNADWLREAADIINADYITIYDTKGDEVVSGARYRGLSLGTDESSATYVFRRLLRGVRYISRNRVKDEVTGLTRDLHGISLAFNSSGDAYGVMLIAADPANGSDAQNVQEKIIDSVTENEGGLSIGVDPETGIIKYSNDDTLEGRTFSDLTGTKPNSEFAGNIKIDGTDYYAVSDIDGGIIYYHAEQRDFFPNSLLRYALACMLAYLAMGVILALILLSGYREKNSKMISAADLAEALKDIRNDIESGDDSSKGSDKFNTRHIFALFNRNEEPKDRAASFIKLTVLIFIIGFIATIILGTGSSESNTVYAFIRGGSWEHSVNQFSVTAILFAFCAVFVIVELLSGVYVFVERFLDQKTQTVAMLGLNIVKTALWIVFVLVSLSYVGVNTGAIFASAGLAGIAISLGAQQTIKDALAGLTTIMSDTYHVGEIIEVNGFRGEVTGVGLINTTVVGTGKNIRTFKNSNMGDITNYSRRNSWYNLELVITSGNSLDEVERIMSEELPKIGQRHSKIISGPYYRGIQKIEGGKITILFLTECSESDMHAVQSIVNREVLSLLDRNNIVLVGAASPASPAPAK